MSARPRFGSPAAVCPDCGARLAWRNGADYCIACSSPKESTPLMSTSNAWPVVQATPADSSHLTGITYATVQTTVQTTLEGDPIGMATDGNGRTTSVAGIDPAGSLVERHYQVLAAHHAGNSVRDYLPGYLSPQRLDGRGSSTLVWVLS